MRTAMLRRTIWLGLTVAFLAAAQKYDGPRPPKPDLPYLKHASNLIPTEAAMAKEEKKKDDTTYVIDGASSSARTPLASPIFLMQAGSISPDKLALYKLETKNGHREIFFPAKKPPQPIRMVVTKLTSDGLWKIEVDESLEPGEYSLSPEGSNQVFCFQVF
ncbi:MAG TPA: hypothetical protein VLY04_10410 [Bryobacteraceae bacterium]|nr:hypothetical protein [Bryobacteraceae bacterium]